MSDTYTLNVTDRVVFSAVLVAAALGGNAFIFCLSCILWPVAAATGAEWRSFWAVLGGADEVR